MTASLFRRAMRHYTLARIGINREVNALLGTATINQFNRLAPDFRAIAKEVFHSDNDDE